ncbi:ABC transporter permease [Xanthobacter sp. V0B-10]|uniref:ABC transporter permease n=1 Tax=Xanthobacter albus TaxID=3119929 RepID=UPI00372C72FE
MSEAPARPTRFAGESWRTASAMHARAVGAVIMRDLQTRFGAGYLGFLLGLIMPLGHLTIAMTVMSVLGRSAPVGPSIPLFAMTGILPFIVWLYTHRQIMTTLAQNRPLLYFPGVDLFDLFSARIILEVSSATLVVVIVLTTLALIGYDINPDDPPRFVYGLIEAWLLGISSGLFFGIAGALAPALILIGSLLGPLFWVTSGIIYLPDLLPEKLIDVLKYFPLCQIVDGTRMGFYSEYQSSFYSAAYPAIAILGLLFISSVILQVVRKVT